MHDVKHHGLSMGGDDAEESAELQEMLREGQEAGWDDERSRVLASRLLLAAARRWDAIV